MRMKLSCLALSVLCLSAAFAGDAPPWAQAWRGPWAPPVQPRAYLRQWLICGPFDVTPAVPAATDFLKAPGGEAAAHPTAGMTVPRPDGSIATWTAYTSPLDYVNLTPVFGGTPRANTVAYAYTTITRPQAGQAYLAVGSDDGVRVWLNGKLVDERVMTRGMFPDNDLIAVAFQAGENHLMVKVEQTVEFWAFMVRVVEEEEVARLEPERQMPVRLWPALLPSEVPGKLIVASDCGWDMPPRLRIPVRVTVTGVGGIPVASQRVPYRQSAVFPVAGWPDGPYDIACTMTRHDGKVLAARRSWYKGDALAAAGRLVASAARSRTSDDPADLVHGLLADTIKLRLGENRKQANPDLLPEFVYGPLMDYAELQQEKAGGVGPRHGNGLVILAYRDETDGSPQLALAYLPAGYDRKRRWPMIVSLHGYKPGDPAYVTTLGANWRFNAQYEDCGAIVLFPFGRGNTGYRGVGEQDVLRCIALAKARLAVDDDRVYLAGFSMGGSGIWLLGSHHPELFAAVASVAGGWDYRVDPEPGEIEALSPADRFREECGSTFAQLESLRTTPVFVTHGDSDHTVPVGNSRLAVTQLQRWGYDVRYWEVPGKGHEQLGSEGALPGWLLQHRREAHPRRVSLRAGELKHATAHWVRIDQRQEQLVFMQADAEIIAPNAIRLGTANVAGLTLSPVHALLDPAKPVKIIWNGELHEERLADGRITLRAPGYTPAPGEKRAVLEGPIGDAQAQPFAIVVGTASADPLMREACAERGRELVTAWERWQHWTPRLYRDTDLPEAGLARYSLLLIGGPADNSVARRLADRLPLTVTAEAITLDGHRFPVQDAVVRMVYPHPLNPDRYVVVTAATSAAGMKQAPRLRDDLDFEILDAGPSVVARGTFDCLWHVQTPYLEVGSPTPPAP